MPDGLRAARERAALTQGELAALAGVSRQLIGAVEAGRHAPSVDAALRIAGALGTSVERLFGGPPPPVASVLGERLRHGDPVRVARVGDRLAAAPLRGLVAGDMAWAAADGIVDRDGVRMLPGAVASGLVVVGCDPVLGLCETLLNRGARRLVAVAGSSGDARAALARGDAHAALVHGPADALPQAPPGALRLHLAAWRVGVGVPGRGGRPSLDAVLDRGAMVQRERSAASQQALLRAVGAAGRGVPALAGRASGHIDAARRAALGGAAAVTFEPAARQHGLRFLPLETHAVELWIDGRWAEHPGAVALGELLASDAFRRRVEAVGGYDLRDCGSLSVAA